MYYKKAYNTGWGDSYKVSKRSMNTILDLLFENNPVFENFAKGLREKIDEEEQEEIKEALYKLDY